jgi:acetyl-CoA carboxylase biotin carboxylase subunit
MIKSLLIANRGEIAVRVIRACKELGIRSVVVYSEADRDSLPVKMADDAVCIGPAPSSKSYLNMSNIIAAASMKHVDAIHPGVGFMSEKEEFAKEVIKNGFIFIGPKPETIARMGDKIAAKMAAKEYGVPCIPGVEGGLTNEVQAMSAAEEMGYPVIIKAAAGGGGKGIRIVWKPEDIVEAYKTAANEAEKAFGDGTLYMEKYLQNPRHIELQLMGDQFGNVVHFGERDCSCQENQQKLVEEAPSPVVTPEIRKEMGECAIRLFKGIGYVGAGTIEFLFYEGKFYFMEVNARIQVEHPVTELVSGYDLIKEQISVCGGAKLSMSQDDIKITGYACEVRINAKTAGTITDYLPAGGYGVRVDSFLYNGYKVSPYYDSMLVKLLVRANDRTEGLNRMTRALDEFVLKGVTTNIPTQRKIINSRIFRGGVYGTDVLKHIMAEGEK